MPAQSTIQHGRADLLRGQHPFARHCDRDGQGRARTQSGRRDFAQLYTAPPLNQVISPPGSVRCGLRDEEEAEQ